MKVTYENSMQYRVMQRIDALDMDIILRKDLSDLGSARQISRALQSLVREKKLAKLGYGIYAKLKQASTVDMQYLPKGFLSTARMALTKLGIVWEPSQAEKDYNERRSQQIPVNPPTKLKTRFRRKLSYAGIELRIE